MEKLGFQTFKGNRVKRFNYIHIKGDLHYCESHNFMYNSEVENKKLHYGLPCYYTDGRFHSGGKNFYKSTYLHFSRYSKTMMGKSISLKAGLRKVKGCYGIPKGTIVEFAQDWSIGKQDHGFLYKVKEYKPIPYKFEVNIAAYSNNFLHDSKMSKLINELRNNGFLVAVYNNNPDFLIGENEGEIAIAYGHGLRVGISTHDNTFRGYSNGRDSILWDNYEDFDKWSRCNEIPKSLTTEEIIKELIKNKYSNGLD